MYLRKKLLRVWSPPRDVTARRVKTQPREARPSTHAGSQTQAYDSDRHSRDTSARYATLRLRCVTVGRKEGVPVVLCAIVLVCVCLWSHTVFGARGDHCVSQLGCRRCSASPSLRVYHTVTPCAYHLLSTNRKGPEYCSHPWCVTCSRPHCRVLCQTLACRSRESGAAALSWRGSARQPLSWDSALLAGSVRCCRCFPMPRFLVCAVLPRVPRFITVLSLPLSLIKKSQCCRT